MAKRSRRQTMRLRASRARVGRSRGMASHLLIIGSNDLTQLTLGVDRDGRPSRRSSMNETMP